MPLDPVGKAARAAAKKWRETHKGMSHTLAEPAIRNNFRAEFGDEQALPTAFTHFRDYFVHELQSPLE